LNDSLETNQQTRESSLCNRDVGLISGAARKYAENFIRCDATTLEIDVKSGNRSKALVLTAVANPATGETAGDTALFEAHADWVKTVNTFDGVLKISRSAARPSPT
jgi:hypothetical protein